jgi:hypothetical protein
MRFGRWWRSCGRGVLDGGATVSAHGGGGARGTAGGSVFSARRAPGERETKAGVRQRQRRGVQEARSALTGGATAGVWSPSHAHAAVAV